MINLITIVEHIYIVNTTPKPMAHNGVWLLSSVYPRLFYPVMVVSLLLVSLV